MNQKYNMSDLTVRTKKDCFCIIRSKIALCNFTLVRKLKKYTRILE